MAAVSDRWQLGLTPPFCLTLIIHLQSTHCLSNPRLLRTPNREALATQVVGDSVPLLLRSYLDCCIRWSSLEIIFFPIYRSFSPHGVGHLNRKMDHA